MLCLCGRGVRSLSPVNHRDTSRSWMCPVCGRGQKALWRFSYNSHTLFINNLYLFYLFYIVRRITNHRDTRDLTFLSRLSGLQIQIYSDAVLHDSLELFSYTEAVKLSGTINLRKRKSFLFPVACLPSHPCENREKRRVRTPGTFMRSVSRVKIETTNRATNDFREFHSALMGDCPGSSRNLMWRWWRERVEGGGVSSWLRSLPSCVLCPSAELASSRTINRNIRCFYQNCIFIIVFDIHSFNS